MTNQITKRPTADISERKVALIAGIALLVMAVLAPLALFGVLQTLVVPAEAAATVENIIASEGLFRIGIAAFLIVLDVVVAWALYVASRATPRWKSSSPACRRRPRSGDWPARFSPRTRGWTCRSTTSAGWSTRSPSTTSRRFC